MTRIVGHRGARGLWPENSLTGFRRTLGLAVDAVEFDVHLTRAGELVVIHDPVLERTTNGTGEVHDLSPAERTAVRLYDSEETLPTLREVLTVLAPAGDVELHVEIKTSAEKRPYVGIVEAVVAELDRFGLRPRCHLASFDLGVLAQCRDVAPDIARLISIDDPWSERQGGLDVVLQQAGGLADIVAVHHPLLADRWDLITAAVPLECLGVWIINEPAEIAAWLHRRIGYLTSDRPDLALTARAERRPC